MLLELTVENIAIIDKASITLDRGFTVLSGETGAGKSLLVDAIQLALGGRADSDLVRSGATKGAVHLLVDVSQCPSVLTKCAEFGIEIEDGQLSIQRELSAEGRSTVRLNGRPTAVGVLKELGTLLVDLHGQHDHQALLVPERQIEFLDEWIGAPIQPPLAEVHELFQQVSSLRSRLTNLMRSHREREQRIDMLSFQIQEIETLNPSIGEIALSQSKIERLKHSERLLTSASHVIDQTVEIDGSALEVLGKAVRELEQLAVIDPELASILTQFQESQLILQEGGRALRSYRDALEIDPETLEATAARLDALKRVVRKYGDTEDEMFAYFENAQCELAELRSGELDEGELRSDLARTEELLAQATQKLSAIRIKKGKEFGEIVTKEVRELAMENARLSVEITSKPQSADGQDVVTFLFSANKGEDMKPLSKVASGGEISRVMLAIKVAGAGTAGVPTMIFDEVDTGLSGRAAAVTAKKMESLSQHAQVIAITHLPQIAARADSHFRIEKESAAERTSTTVRKLESEERLTEIARMLAGEQIGESALANARELVSGKN